MHKNIRVNITNSDQTCLKIMMLKCKSFQLFLSTPMNKIYIFSNIRSEHNLILKNTQDLLLLVTQNLLLITHASQLHLITHL